MSAPSILVMGVGNLLLGDEGAGIRTLERLAREGLPDGVSALDGGTGGFHLLSHLQGPDIVVLIDASLDGRPPGTVRVLEPRFAHDFPRSLSAHDIGLRDLIETATLLAPLPRMFLVTISIELDQELGLGLSPAVCDALPEAAEAVRGILRRLRGEASGGAGAAVTQRSAGRSS